MAENKEKELDPTAEVIKRFESLEGDKKRLNDEVAELRVRLDRAEKSRAVSLPGSEDKQISFAKVVRGMAMGGLDNAAAWEDAGYEREVGLQARKRALTFENGGSSGAYIVPEQQMTTLIEPLRNKTVAYEMGAVDFGPLAGAPITIPMLTAGATAYWTGEGSAITESQQTFDQLTATPHELGCLVPISNRLIALSNPAAESTVRNDMTAVMARKLDAAILRGDGSGASPVGIKHYTGINTKTSVGSPDVDDLYDWLYELELDNADEGTLGWVFNPRTLNTLRKIKNDTNGLYVLQPDPTNSLKGTLLGYKYRATNAIPKTMSSAGDTDVGSTYTEAYFGNWADLLVCRWGGMSIEASNVAGDAFSKNLTYVRAIGEFDIALRHPESFLYASGISA